jgi:hypothetical protein
VLKVERIVERNLMVENKLLRLPNEVGCLLAGGSLLTTEQTDATEVALVDGLVSLIQGKVLGARHFLMIGHESWQPLNRIVMHNRLWRSMEKRSVPLPAGEKSEEYLVESGAGVKFFGFIECEHIKAQQISNVLRSGPACALIATSENNPHDVLATVARRGWEKSQMYPYPPIEILKIACRTRTIIYALIGFFDDRERGLAVIAKPSWIDSIFECA